MLTKKDWIIIGIGLFLILAVIWAMGYGYDKKYQEVESLKNQNAQLRLELGTKSISQDKKIKDQTDKITGLNQELEQIKIKYQADEMYIQTLEYRYTRLYSYALLAEEILIANGIEFRMVEGGLDYKSLRGEEK